MVKQRGKERMLQSEERRRRIRAVRPQVPQNDWVPEGKGGQTECKAAFCKGTSEFGLYPEGDRKISVPGVQLDFYRVDV